MKIIPFALLVMASAVPVFAQKITVSPSATQATQAAPAASFTGTARIEWRFAADEPGRASGGMVSFAAGARTHWHSHPLGQTLIVTKGVGRVQQWGESIQEIREGDIVRIPPNVKHWHGASPESAMSHLAIGERLDGQSVEWMEPVSDTDFAATPHQHASPEQSPAPSRAQQLMGGVAPKLADLTDEVLYADVWERPQLSKRDRSLATVSALIAMNRPNQLRSHLAIAVRNGVTQEELSEVITHLAFYAGWPSSVDAVGVAKEIFQP